MSIDCKWTATLLVQEADGDLTSEQGAWLERHVSDCPACRQQREQFLAIDRQATLYGQLAATGMLEAAPRKASKFRWVPATTAAVAATVLLAVALSLQAPPQAAKSEVRVVDRADGGFVPIPYVPALAPYETGRVVHVEVPVAALTAAGYRIRMTDPTAIVQADVLVGEDGRAHAVRLVPNVGLN